MKLKYFLLSLLMVLLLFPFLNYAQQYPDQSRTDTTKEKLVQYRRGVVLNENYQSYEEKYAGKNLIEEKRRLFPLQSTGIWTELNPKVPRVDYLGIQFVNKDTGWAVGDLGALIKSTDGGQSWTVSETNTTTPILKVRSFNGQIVIASGFGGLILRSTDGGETFMQVTSNVTGDLWGLQMINDTLGWACGTGNSLVKTTDGGQTWQRIFTPGYTSDYWWIDFHTESYGLIAANGKVLRTTDGGLNWEIIQAGDSYPLFSIDVIDSLHIAAAGYGGTGYSAKNIYSSDGGYNWINGGSLTMESVNCIKYVNTDTGYVIMTNVIGKKTTNRGQEWTGIALGGEYEMQFFNEENFGYSAGTELRVYKTENNYENWQRLIINDNFSDVFFISEQKGFAISSSAFSAPSGLYITTDSGLNWQKYPSGINGIDLLFTDSLTGFIAGTPFRIWKTTDSGISWYFTNITGLSDTLGTINKIFFINPATGWAVTSRGGILKTTDGGDNWFAQFNAGVSVSFNSIYFIDSLNGWTANFDRPFKTTNGGINWVQQTSINIWNSDDVYFYNYLKGWIIAGNELYFTVNGGINWTLDPQIYTYSRNFETISNTHFIITGTNIYESVDTGIVWQNVTNQVGSYFTALHAPEDYLAYGVGTLGYIVSYLDTSIIPAELINFSAEYTYENKVILYWRTATEKNNYGFEILRSDNIDNWVNIGFVSGNGTTTDQNDYSFTDNKIFGSKIYYRLKQIDFDGSFTYSKIVYIKISINHFTLSQNFPNPANPSTNISFSIPIKARVQINLYSVLGEFVRTLIDEDKDSGIYHLNVDFSNLPSGVYFYKMTTNNGYTNVKKMILLK